MRAALLICALLLSAGCRADDSDDTAPAQERGERDGRVATALGRGADRVDSAALERDRMNMDWRDWVPRDTAAAADSLGPADTSAAAGARNERWEQISPTTVNTGAIALPVRGDVSGPSVIRVQVLLDRALFSPGIIDGRWGRNTEKAVYWLQRREGLRTSGHVDEATWQRLTELAGDLPGLVRQHTLTSDDVAGPFVDLPEEPYDRRDLDCQCYESLAEKLAERFHTSPDLLRQLNDGVDLNAVTAGRTLYVPNVDRSRRAVPGTAQVARIVISDGGSYLHALDAGGRILYHFPATLGSAYSPSPSGDYRVTGIAHDPTWHYQPALLEGVPDDEPDAVLPPGPNNAVGVVWMQLSKEHYGIHGTSAPETIGYATSNGCVRLTNWDADFLSRRISAGVPVEFRDVRG